MSRTIRKHRSGRLAHGLAVAAVVVGVGAAFPTATPLEAQDAPSSHPLLPDTVLEPEGRPRIVVLRTTGSPLVSLRVSVPVREGPSEAGAGRLLATLGLARARSMAGPVSARIEGGRTPDGIAYSVTGALEDFDYLTYLLRLAVDEPEGDRIDFQRARNDLMEEARRARETASGRLARQLHDRAFPDAAPLGGTVESLTRMTSATLRDVWARTHEGSRMTLVITGDVPHELILLAPQGLGARTSSGEEPPREALPPERGVETQVLRRWYGEAWRLPDPRDPRGRVAAVVVADHMRDTGGAFESMVQLWELDGRRALAVMGAAYSRADATMRDRVGSALRRAAEEVTPAEVEAAVARVRRQLLFDARTPWGRADVVGRHLAATGDPTAARAWLARLDDVTAESLRAYLLDLASGTPVRAEVRP